MQKNSAATTSETRHPGGGSSIGEDYESFLSGLRDKDRRNVERHLAFCEEQADPNHVRLWKRLVCLLTALAPKATETVGSLAVQFFTADGKYRLQTFALEDPRDGTLIIYAADVIEKALKDGIIKASTDKRQPDSVRYSIAGNAGEELAIEPIVLDTTTPPSHYRHMLGWNRKAIRITLPTAATSAQVRAAEQLCSLTVH